MVSEICVTIKDSEKTLRSKYLIYEVYTVEENNPTIQKCVEQTLENFDGEPDQIIVSIKFGIQ